MVAKQIYLQSDPEIADKVRSISLKFQLSANKTQLNWKARLLPLVHMLSNVACEFE